MESNSKGNNQSLIKFVGLWHITEMEMWDADYFNMETQAYLEIKPNGLGDFQFGLVAGEIHGEVETLGNSERFSFTWEGSDEMDSVSGSGWIKLKDSDKVTGKIKFHMGDISEFQAVKIS